MSHLRFIGGAPYKLTALYGFDDLKNNQDNNNKTPLPSSSSSSSSSLSSSSSTAFFMSRLAAMVLVLYSQNANSIGLAASQSHLTPLPSPIQVTSTAEVPSKERDTIISSLKLANTLDEVLRKADSQTSVLSNELKTRSTDFLNANPGPFYHYSYSI